MQVKKNIKASKLSLIYSYFEEKWAVTSKFFDGGKS